MSGSIAASIIEKRDAEWKRAREAWNANPDQDDTETVYFEFTEDAAAFLDQFFGGGEGTVNLDTNRVCPKCLHQYNDRVNQVCNDKEPK